MDEGSFHSTGGFAYSIEKIREPVKGRSGNKRSLLCVPWTSQGIFPLTTLTHPHKEVKIGTEIANMVPCIPVKKKISLQSNGWKVHTKFSRDVFLKNKTKTQLCLGISLFWVFPNLG